MSAEENIVNKCKITIITVVKNGDKYIERSIRSVLNQKNKNFEYIIIDGYSTDNTINIIQKYKENITIWKSEPDSGIYNALNKAIKLVKTEYYLTLGCDDVVYENMIDDFYKNLVPKSIIMAKVLYGDSQKKILNHSTGMLIKKDAHNKYGYYDESYKIAADTKFIGLVVKNNDFCVIDEVVGKFYEGGVSSVYRATIKEHSKAMLESNSWPLYYYYWWLLPRIVYSYFRH